MKKTSVLALQKKIYFLEHGAIYVVFFFNLFIQSFCSSVKFSLEGIGKGFSTISRVVSEQLGGKTYLTLAPPRIVSSPN